jgi:DNA polymerase-1
VAVQTGKKGRKEPRVFMGEEHLDKLADDPALYVDLETCVGTSTHSDAALSPFLGKIAVVTMFSEKTNSVVIAHPRGRPLSKRLKHYLEGRAEMIGHNLGGFDLQFMVNAGVDISGVRIWDTMLAESAILTSDRRDVRVSLKASAARRLKTTLKKLNDHTGWAKPTLTDLDVRYCVEDVCDLARLKQAQIERADKEQIQAIAVECELVHPMVKMALNGLPVNSTKLKKAIAGQKEVAEKMAAAIQAKLGSMNLGSPVQLRKAMNEWLEARAEPPMKSTAADMLLDQAMFGGEFGELCERVIEHRHANQRIKMYPIPQWIDRFVVDGRIHPHWWTASTDTMRMSCSDPNLQQWPRDMRGVVGGLQGYSIVKCDLQQAEIRMAAAVSGCPGLRKAFDEGLHIHSDIASKSFHIPYNEVATRNGGQYKQLGKALTFTMLFAGGTETFMLSAKRAGVDLDEAEADKIFRDFFTAYPGIKRLKDTAKGMSRSHHTVIRLPTGAKRVLVSYNNSPSKIMNTLIQGGAAAGLKFGMLEAHRRGLFEFIGAAVHDELVACVPDKMAKDVGREMEISMNLGMESVMDGVKSQCEVKIGKWWQ